MHTWSACRAQCVLNVCLMCAQCARRDCRCALDTQLGEQGAHMEQVADRFRGCRESLPIGFWLVDSRLHNRCQLRK